MIDKKEIEQMTALIMEDCMLSIADMARKIAVILPPEISGKTALEAFARSMEETNNTVWPKSEVKQ